MKYEPRVTEDWINHLIEKDSLSLYHCRSRGFLSVTRGEQGDEKDERQDGEREIYG